MRALKLKSPVPAAAPAKFTSSVANLAGDDDEELNLNLNLARTPSVAVTKPSLLQPRVVVFDGVCHLCHTSYLSFSLFLSITLLSGFKCMII